MNDLPVIGFPAVLFQSMPIHVCREICCILESVAPWGCHLQTLIYFWKGQKRKACLSSRFVSPESSLFPGMKRCNATQEVLQSSQWKDLSLQVKQDAFLWDVWWERESKQRVQKAFPHGWNCKDIPIHCGENAVRNTCHCWKGVFFTLELLIHISYKWQKTHPLYTR